MVMTLGMSPEIGQRLLGGQQGGGPFMGRAFAQFFEETSGRVENWTPKNWRGFRSNLTRAYFSDGLVFCDLSKTAKRHLSKSLTAYGPEPTEFFVGCF